MPLLNDGLATEQLMALPTDRGFIISSDIERDLSRFRRGDLRMVHSLMKCGRARFNPNLLQDQIINLCRLEVGGFEELVSVH